MIESQQALHPAIKYEIEVQEPGRVELSVPFAPGVRLIIFVIQDNEPVDAFADLVAAAGSSTAFWDNPLDDEDWNNA